MGAPGLQRAEWRGLRLGDCVVLLGVAPDQGVPIAQLFSSLRMSDGRSRSANLPRAGRDASPVARFRDPCHSSIRLVLWRTTRETETSCSISLSTVSEAENQGESRLARLACSPVIISPVHELVVHRSKTTMLGLRLAQNRLSVRSGRPGIHSPGFQTQVSGTAKRQDNPRESLRRAEAPLRRRRPSHLEENPEG